jgi:hypothetical protein
MADRGGRWADDEAKVPRAVVDEGNASAELTHDRNYVWDPIGLAWVRMTQPGGGGGGGGAVTVADGADVAQGTTTDLSSANTVVGILKAIKAAVQGTLTVATHAVTQSGAWTTGRTWTLLNTTDSVNVGNFPVTQPVSGTVTADTELPAASALADTDTNPTTSRVGANGLLWNGTSWDRAPGDKTSGAKVQSAQLPAALDGSGFLKTHEQGVAHIDDNAGSLTVDAPVGTPVFVRLSDGAAALVGQKVMASSLPVAIASDQGALDVSDRAARLLGHVDGTISSGVTDAGNPVKTGGLATFPALPTLVATGQRVNDYSDLAGALITRKRPISMYSAVYRAVDATAGGRNLAFTFVANTDKQWATIYHAATATKRIQIKYVGITISFVGTTGAIEWEIQPLSATTAPATGNPAITPGKHDQADAAAEATCLALPTTQGSVTAVNSPVGNSYFGNQGATTTPTPITIVPDIVLWDSRSDGDGKDLIMRAGVAEGFAVVGRMNAASLVQGIIKIIFTEE